MCKLSRLIYIKDLLIFQSNTVYKMIEEYVESAKLKGVSIGDLATNSYIFESRSLDVSYLINYIKSLNNLAGVFRDLYDDYLYKLRLQLSIDDIIYQDDNQFQMIFNAINNTFNRYLDDQYLFEDFSIYQSQTSVETCMALLDTFYEYFTFLMSKYIDKDYLKQFIMQNNIALSQIIYDKIFEQFEYIYLPFY